MVCEGKKECRGIIPSFLCVYSHSSTLPFFFNLYREGICTKIFNVGRYRREAYAEVSSSASGACDANFFDSKNEEGAALRQKVAEIALRDMLRWIDGEDETNGDNQGKPRDRIAIFDATNSTNTRRQWVLEECTSPEKRRGKPTGCVFVESICDDKELLMENFNFKISNSPDYKGMTREAALADLQMRVKKYEEKYETIADDSLSYIKIFNLSTKLMVNHIYGRMSKLILPALMAWNIGTRPIFLCRPGQTVSGITTDDHDVVDVSRQSLDMSINTKKRLLRGDSLSPIGRNFSNELYEFMFEESMDFLLKRSSIMDMAETGTSMSGLAGNNFSEERDAREPPFPYRIYTSTMPRAAETVTWQEYDFKVEELSNLNPLDKGDFAGKELEEIQATNPEWYSKLQKNPFLTRFPGGESYKDVIRRLESVVVELEQQVVPTLVVSHVSVLQVLIAYFRNSPIEECMSIEIPLHSVVKFTPARGGGWSETRHTLSPVLKRFNSEKDYLRDDSNSTPIWGDH